MPKYLAVLLKVCFGQIRCFNNDSTFNTTHIFLFSFRLPNYYFIVTIFSSLSIFFIFGNKLRSLRIWRRESPLVVGETLFPDFGFDPRTFFSTEVKVVTEKEQRPNADPRRDVGREHTWVYIPEDSDLITGEVHTHTSPVRAQIQRQCSTVHSCELGRELI